MRVTPVVPRSAPTSAAGCFAHPPVTKNSVYASVSGAHRLASFWLPQAAAVTALDRATGKLRWSCPLPVRPGEFLKGFLAAPVVAGDLVLAAGLDGMLYAFPAE